MNKIVALVNLSRSFQLRVLRLSIVRNGKLGVRKPRNLNNVPQRKLRGFQLRVLGIVQNGKLPSGKTDSLRFPSRPRALTMTHVVNSQSPKRVVCRSV